jgi:hypothetical protein
MLTQKACGTMWEPIAPETMASIETQYNATVLANYAAANSGKSPSGGWPEEQAVLMSPDRWELHTYFHFGQKDIVSCCCKHCYHTLCTVMRHVLQQHAVVS